MPVGECSIEVASPLTAVSVTTTPVWFGSEDRPLLGWLTAPATGVSAVGVVVAPPVGYEYWTSHRTLRTLAERLAGQGCSVLRVDYDGTGDSAGDQWDGDRLCLWSATIEHACSELRRIGAIHISLIGLRLGATLALQVAGAMEADSVVAWAPVLSGRRYIRELRMLGMEIPSDAEGSRGNGALVTAGFVFREDTLADLARVDLATLQKPGARRALVIDRDDRPRSGILGARLPEIGTTAEHRTLKGTETALDFPAEYATVPHQIVDEICQFIGPSTISSGIKLRSHGSARITHGSSTITEEVVTIGARRLAAVVGHPAGVPRATVVFLNSGSEPHIGPGRAWVEIARSLTVRGYTTVRLDFSGWGESPDEGHAPGRPYDSHCLDETLGVVETLRGDGHDQIVLVGLCAGAWMALRAALEVPLAGVIAINPQMYWQPGDPVEADIIAETRRRRAPEIKRFKRGARWKLWSVLDLFGIHHPASVWLRRLQQVHTPVLALFAEGDDGLEFLRDRTSRALRMGQRQGTIHVEEVAGLDHPLHRHWQRHAVISSIKDFLDSRLTP